MAHIKKTFENIELSIWLALIPRMKETHPIGIAIQSVYGLFAFQYQSVEKGFFVSLISIILGLMTGVLMALAHWMNQ